MKKRIYALALCLLLLVAFPFTAFAEGESASAPELTVSTERTDDTLTVTVGIKNNPGIAGVDLALHFNSAVLTLSAAPEMAEGWAHCITNYTAQFSGDTLKVVSVREENFCGDTLFTADFAVKGSGSYGLSVSGTACTAAEDRIELAVFADDFGVKDASRSASGVTFTIASFGKSYHGDANAILARYQDGKFIGCVIKNITINENSTANVAFDAESLSGDTLRLMLTDGSFTPLCAPMDVN